MKIIVLDAETLGADLDLSPLEEVGSPEIYAYTSPEEIADRIADADVVLANKARLTRDNLKNAAHLKLITEAATGYDNIDMAFCREKGIAVCNVAGYSTNSVTQVTVATVLSLATRLSEYGEHVQSGAYSRGNNFNCLTPVYHELCGNTWGIIGYGDIGAGVAKVAEALGCRVIAYTRTPRKNTECVDLETLCRTSDIISIHVPLTDQTRGMIGERELSFMKQGCILVNEARGAVVDETAVAAAVEAGNIMFGCDVYSVEPFRENHPYFHIKDNPKVLLTPHMAWGAYEARSRCLTEIVENIRAFVKGERRNRVD